MSYTSKQTIIESLEWMIEKSQTVMERNQMIASADEFLRSPSRMEKFDAACMLIQVIGETAKRIDEQTSRQLFSTYPEIYWRGVFGCRNIISHEYGNVDPEQIFIIIKKHLPLMVDCIHRIVADIHSGRHDSLFLR